MLESLEGPGSGHQRIQEFDSICMGEQLVQQLQLSTVFRQQIPSFARAAASSSGVGSVVDMMIRGSRYCVMIELRLTVCVCKIDRFYVAKNKVA